MARIDAGTIVRTKRRCCNSSPRCRRCPVVWRRLVRAGLAERLEERRYVVVGPVRKKTLKAARRNR